MDYETVLGRLCALAGPSGFEGPVAREAAELLRPLTDEAKVDRMGSVVALRRCGKENAPRLLLDAHLDEIGFIVTGHEDGFLCIAPLGGVDPRMLPDRELTILAQPPRLGVVACMPPHIQTREEMDKSQPMREMAVDVGLTQEEAQRLIPIGTPAVYRTGCSPLGGDLLCGKALDDRACFAILLDTLERLQGEELDVDLYVLGSTQEETHSTGAITAAFGIVPDLCVAVDVTHGKTPDSPGSLELELGKGPAIGIGPNMTRWTTQRMLDKAEKEKIPYQTEVMTGHTGTNGWHMQIAREGVATSVVSLPLKYMHTPIEVLEEQDIERVAALLAAFAQGLDREVFSCGKQ